MSVKLYLTKHQYLWRFILTLVVILLIPSILFINVVVIHSYNEMQRKNEDYYIDITGSFALFFQTQLASMKTRALNISFETKRGHSALLLSSIEQDPYYYKECVDELAHYRSQDPFLYDIGIFYYGRDYVFTHTTKYNILDFCQLYMNIDSSDTSSARKHSFIEVFLQKRMHYERHTLAMAKKHNVYQPPQSKPKKLNAE